MRIALFVATVLLLISPVSADESVGLFSDHFASLDPGWGAANANKNVSDGKLVLKPDANSGFSTIRSGSYFRDADIRVKVRLASGGTDESAGLVFWAADVDNYYLAQITTDAMVGITRFVHNRQLTPLSYATNKAVNKGLGQTNELRVLTVGKSATLYVNGQEIATTAGFPPPSGGRIGLHAESGATVYTWEFSDLEVLQPPLTAAPTTTTAAADPSILFSDNFATLDPAWGVPSTSKSVLDGSFRLEPAANGSHTTLYQGALFGDADIRVRIAETSGGTDETGGLVFWATDLNNYYLAQITPDGLVGVTRFMRGQQMNPVSYARSGAVRQGVGAVNEMRVVTQGQTATLVINGQGIAALRGFPPRAGGQIGLHGESGETPYVWQFAGLEVHRVTTAATPSPPADAAVLFSDNFSTLDPGWGPPDGIQSVAEGKLIFKPAAGSSYVSLYQGTLFDDADIRVKISEIEGDMDEPAGIVFWASDYNNFYTAQVLANGSAGISQFKQGRWVAPVPYKARDSVAKGVGQVNELRVVTQGKRATFYVNGQEIAAIDGTPPNGGSKIGFRAVSGMQSIYTWSFSELTFGKP